MREVPKNQILNLDCVVGMQGLPDCCIALTVTSPPYDALRKYGGHEFPFEQIATELYRITMVGGVLVWVVAEQIIDGSESGTSSEQRLYFRDLGFRIHQTMLMNGLSSRHNNQNRYGGPLTHAFILSKGAPRYVNVIRDRLNKWRGCKRPFKSRHRDGHMVRGERLYETPTWGARGPIWDFATGSHVAEEKFTAAHPARMAESIARDHILSWSKPGNLVLDPMAGSGTTCKQALLNHRRYLGFEIHQPYFEIAMRRMTIAHERYAEQLANEFWEGKKDHTGTFQNQVNYPKNAGTMIIAREEDNP